MIERFHVDRYKELIDSELYVSKRAAGDQLIDESVDVQDMIGVRYKDRRSLRIVLNQQLQRYYPGHATTPSGPRGSYGEEPSEIEPTLPLDGWTVEEKLDAADLEIQTENVRLGQLLQNLRDRNRIANKSFRDHARRVNADMAFDDAIQLAIEKLPGCVTDFPTRSGPLDPDSPVFIAQLSDLHMNEIINMGSVNKYDFDIASKRLHKYAQFLKLQAKVFGAERVVFAFGGDLLNSDRLIDEKLTEAQDRANAAIIAAEILYLLIMDMRADFFVDVLGVVGNEGRVGEKQAWSKKAARYNYDLSVLRAVKQLCSITSTGDDGLRFYLDDMGVNERTFTIHDYTFLILHGNQGRVAGGAQKTVQAVIGKYAVNKDKRVNKVLAGHIHSAHASDFFARNSSLAGSNDYSDSLQFISRASQNLHVVTRTGDCFSMVVDLQDTTGIEGYEIEDMLDEFGVETADGPRRARRPDHSHIDLC